MDQLVSETTTKPTESRAGKDLLISQIADITNRVESLVVERIDSLITRLENFKAKTILENKASVAKFAAVIENIDDGLQQTTKLEELVERMDRQ
jgi:hypothetical protein